MRALIAGARSSAVKTSLRFVIAPFANLGGLGKISQLGSSCWHSVFGNRNYYHPMTFDTL